MGLFDFASEIGSKLFDSTENAAEQIKAAIEAENLPIDKLGVKFASGKVTIIGICCDQETVEKAILIAGNVQGVSQVIPEIYVSDEEEAASIAVADTNDKVEYYVIQSGDTLSKLAKQYYDDAMQYTRLFEANREVIKDPDKIYVGQKIRIPLD